MIINNSKKNTTSTMRTLLPYLWPKNELELKFRVVASMICLIIGKIIGVIIPIAYKNAVDGLTKDHASFMIIGILLSYSGARIFSQVFNELRDAIFAKVGQDAMRKIALNVFTYMHQLSLRFHLERKMGSMSRVIERGTKGIETLLRFSFFNIIPTIFEIILVCWLLFISYGIWFSLITLITMVLYIAYTLFITEWRISFVKEMNERDNQVNNKAIESLINFETVKYFCNEKHEAKRFDESLMQYEEAAIKNITSLSFLNVGQGVIIAIGLTCIMFLASIGVKNNTMTVGDFVLVNTYLLQLSIPLFILGFAYREIKISLLSIENMFSLLSVPIEVKNASEECHLNVTNGEIKFEHISFGYDKERTILNNINFIIEKGETLAIVGASGSGKSTITRLLFRFYDIKEGSITIDNQDVRNVTQESLRKVIGIVPQDTVLFNDTIYYNIAYGNMDAKPENVFEAARMAHIHEFILHLPEGYNTIVGERGLKLSGGEKQRVAIARTILKNPRIYIFDEATSSLDTNTEKSIQASLKEISLNKTTLIIAHRLSTIIEANEIILIDKGSIIERGTHQELLSLGSLYAKLWNKQQEEAKIETLE